MIFVIDVPDDIADEYEDELNDWNSDFWADNVITVERKEDLPKE